MKKNNVLTGLLVLTTLYTITVSLSQAKAEEENVIRVSSGETIEVGTDSLATKPDFSWILTKDRKFQNAQRGTFFQTRLAQAGTYVLDVSIQDRAGGGSEYRAFTIIVTDGPTPSPEYPPAATDETPLRAVLRTAPASQGGRTYLPPTGGIVRLDPSLSEGKITSYDMDTDSLTDSDGDGNPMNDRSTDGSLSQKSGSPIYFYVLPKGEGRTMTLSVGNLSVATPSVTTLGIVHGTGPSAGSLSSSAQGTNNLGSPILMEKDGLGVRFSAQLDHTVVQGKELLFQWDFGDRKKSLLNSPRHTYGAPGTYAVTLSIRDISSGEILWSGNDGVTVESTEQNSPSSAASSSASEANDASSSSSSSSKESAKGTNGGAPRIISIIYVGFIMIMLIALAIGMYFVIHWLKTKSTSGIQNTLEKMENSIVKRESKEEIVRETEPMKLKKEATTPPDSIVDSELAKEDFKTQERANTPPITTSGPVPSWLAKGQPTSDSAPRKQASAPAAPVPDWLQKESTVQAAEKPPTITTSKAPVLPTTPAEPVPDWLKPTTAKLEPRNPVEKESNTISGTGSVAPVPGQPVTPTTQKTTQAPQAPGNQSSGTVSETKKNAPLEQTTSIPVATAAASTPLPQRAVTPVKQTTVKPLGSLTPRSSTGKPATKKQEDTSVEGKQQKEEARATHGQKPSANLSESHDEKLSKKEETSGTIDTDPPIAFIQADSIST